MRAFVCEVWSAIRAACPQARLLWIGGPEARGRIATERAFADPTISVLDSVPAVAPVLRAAALTINPQPTLRGSSIKVLESLAHGRICLSTSAGARGHHSLGLPGLVCRDAWPDFAETVVALFRDEGLRHQLERPDPDALSRASWSACAHSLRALVRGFLAGT